MSAFLLWSVLLKLTAFFSILFYFYSVVLYCIVLCIVVPLPPGTYPFAVNNNIDNNNNSSYDCI
jgi:hypothetical protein